MNKRTWYPGDPTPEFAVRSSNSPLFNFDITAGRYVVLSFLGSGGQESVQRVIQHIQSRRALFDDKHLCFYGVSVDEADEAQNRLRQSIPGIRYFWDFDRQVSALYGAVDAQGTKDLTYGPFTLVLDPMLRVLAYLPILPAEDHNRALDYVLNSLPPVAEHAGTRLNAPVLVLPRVLDPEMCRELIGQYQQFGGKPSGFMRAVGGKTVTVMDKKFKIREDFNFESNPELAPLRKRIQSAFIRRLVPEIQRAFQFEATRIERYVVACYDSGSGGFFRPHRDNTTPGTAHRRFACTINLNADDYEGGELRFPEFGPQTYRAPTGGAVVFSCSLLHEATPVTAGTRYAFLPFFYNEAAAEIRKRNLGSFTGQFYDREKGQNEYSDAESGEMKG